MYLLLGGRSNGRVCAVLCGRVGPLDVGLGVVGMLRLSRKKAGEASMIANERKEGDAGQWFGE